MNTSNSNVNNWMEANDNNVVLFYPHVPYSAIESVSQVLSTRWIGQGPKVDEFEMEFSKLIENENTVAVGSGTDALHIAYLLADISPGDEVITPVFTCTATNLPLLYIGAKPVFADIDPKTMNISPESIRSKITSRTKAIVTVDYGGLPCDYESIKEIADEHNLLIIDDAAHAVGAKYNGVPIGSVADFTTFSFQAIKHITTGDGGLLSLKNPDLLEKARRLRWFGIDRKAKQGGIWANDIYELGYKYQMTDIGASIGLAGIRDFESTLAHRRRLLDTYMNELKNVDGLYNIGSEDKSLDSHAAWIHTVAVENRVQLQAKLRTNNIESAPVHYRNDMYSVLGGRSSLFPNMDQLEDKYLVLPLHMKVTEEDVFRICTLIKQGW